MDAVQSNLELVPSLQLDSPAPSKELALTNDENVAPDVTVKDEPIPTLPDTFKDEPIPTKPEKNPVPCVLNV